MLGRSGHAALCYRQKSHHFHSLAVQAVYLTRPRGSTFIMEWCCGNPEVFDPPSGLILTNLNYFNSILDYFNYLIYNSKYIGG